MNRFIGQLQGWWGGRSTREQRMLAVMIVLVFAVLAWALVVRPASAWRADAAERRERAESALAEVQTALARLAPAATREAAPPSEGLEPLVRRTAEAASIPAVTTMDASGRLGVQVSQVGARAVFPWLAALESDHGLLVCSLGVVENADATLNIEASLARGRCTAA